MGTVFKLMSLQGGENMTKSRRGRTRKLRALRAELDFSQAELAEVLGISQGAYSDKELGHTSVTVPEAWKLMILSGKAFEEIFPVEDIFLPEDYKKLVVKSENFTVRPVAPHVFEVDGLKRAGNGEG